MSWNMSSLNAGIGVGGIVGGLVMTHLSVEYVTYTLSLIHNLRAHETRHDLVCRLLLEKKKKKNRTSEESQ
ncbi:hypothetical protein CDFC105_64021 [Clostridioides difficile]|nr:hypothetical protein CDFC105_64021 [Clostridioides difficile]